MDIRDLIAAFLRLRGAILEFGVAFVAAQLAVTLVAAVPALRRHLPEPLGSWLVPPFARRVLRLPLPAVRGNIVFAAIAGLPSLLPTAVLGPAYVVARLAGAGLIGALAARLPAIGGDAPASLAGGPPPDEPGNPPGLGDGLLALLSDLFTPFLISAVLGGVCVSLVPREVIVGALGPSRPWAPVLAAWLALPFRAVGGTELPLAGALLVAGAGPGAATALLIAAPVLHYESLRQRRGRAGLVLPALTWLVAALAGFVLELALVAAPGLGAAP